MTDDAAYMAMRQSPPWQRLVTSITWTLRIWLPGLLLCFFAAGLGETSANVVLGVVLAPMLVAFLVVWVSTIHVWRAAGSQQPAEEGEDERDWVNAAWREAWRRAWRPGPKE